MEPALVNFFPFCRFGYEILLLINFFCWIGLDLIHFLFWVLGFSIKMFVDICLCFEKKRIVSGFLSKILYLLLFVFCKETKRLGCNWFYLGSWIIFWLIETKILNLYLLELCFVCVMLPNLSSFCMYNVFMYIYSFLAIVKIKESTTKANLLWRAKSKPWVRILIRFQLKTYLPCYYLLLVF